MDYYRFARSLSPIGFAGFNITWKAGGRVIKRSLSRDIGAALAFKAVALTLIYLLFFSGSRAPVVTPSEMAGFLTDSGWESKHR
jgi:hypothetical protein